MRNRSVVLLLALAAAPACSGGGGGGSGSRSVAPVTSAPVGSGATATPGATTTPGVASFAGTWDVSGTDPARGAFSGTASVAAAASGGYTVERLVTFAAKLPNGRDLQWGWNATAKDEAGGMRLDASLVRAHVFRRAGSTTRTAADQAPLAVSGLFLAPGGGPVGLVSVGTKMSVTFAGGLAETWTRSNATATPLPPKAVRTIPAHSPPTATEKKVLDTTFASFRSLPWVSPYAARPEFQAGIHEVILDTTALDFYQKRGPTAVLLLDKVADDVAVAEETRRANAFSYHLFEKAKLFDDEMAQRCSDANGMVTALDTSKTPAARIFAQSPVLYTGTWAFSQLYRYQTTKEQEAFDNVVRAATGAVLCVEVPAAFDKTQFARAVDMLANAAPGQVQPTAAKYGWVAGTGAYASYMWMAGGNNDMLHGIEGGLMAGAAILPAGHPLRARIGAAAASLVDNVAEAQNGLHEVGLSYLAASIVGDPVHVARYQKALGLRNLKDQLYLTAGGNLLQDQGIADWSGHNLGLFSYHVVRLLGGSNPTGAEKTWRSAGQSGIKAGFGFSGAYRNGFLAATAAGSNVPGASDVVKGVLQEIPFPKTTGDVEVDHAVSADFCLSPHPSLPWKLDWTTNRGRVQSLRVSPIFYRGGDQNLWNRTPLYIGSGPDATLQPGQDFLVAYWFARSVGALGPLD